MNQYIDRCKSGDFEHKYLLPFLHLHGEPLEEIDVQLDAMLRSGIRQVCVESRPHPEFCKAGWWRDVGHILERAEQTGMKVWILDDFHFPSGHAAFYIKNHPELRRKLLKCEYRDILVQNDSYAVVPYTDKENTLIGAYAYRRGEEYGNLYGAPVALKADADGKFVHLDLPNGLWRVCYLMQTYFAHNEISPYYIDIMNPDSCAAMLKAVYEPHYKHFGKYFGTVLKGFFSDEPGFNNTYNLYDGIPGKPADAPLPWNSELPGRLSKKLGISERDVMARLPMLWLSGEHSSETAVAYMQCITDTYSENFNRLIGEWCRAHGVEYIGHIIEDMGCHQHMGWGAGHYFKALRYQDMAGIDAVLHQIVPGINNTLHTAPLLGEYGVASPEFFQDTLPKLGTSLAHITPHMKNRTLCEIFGGFGWVEGVPFMRRLADIMLSRGVNYFVPHAYNERKDDNSCPPYFCNRASFSQETAYDNLAEYMQRAAMLFEDNENLARVAVVYCPEAEWCGKSFISIDKIARTLSERQIDFDFVPWEYLEIDNVKNGEITVGNGRYSTVVLPGCTLLPAEIAARIDLLGMKMRTVIAGPVPDCIGEGDNCGFASCTKLSAEELCDYLCSAGASTVRTDRECDSLRVYHSKREKRDIYFLYNQSAGETLDFYLLADGALYDVWANRLYRPQSGEDGIRICLAPMESIAVVPYDTADLPPYPYCDGEPFCTNCSCAVTVAKRLGEKFCEPKEQDELSMFGGLLHYETEFSSETGKRVLELPYIGETAEVTLNGIELGVRVGPSCRYDITGLLHPGKNVLQITVAGNAAFNTPDFLSTWSGVSASGFSGEIRLFD